MSVEIVSDPSPKGMSTRKKWLIGCGGCLGVLVVLAVIAVVAISTGWNSLQKGSSESVKKLFGESYNSEGYLAFAIPWGKPAEANLVMMLSSDQSTLIIAQDKVGLKPQWAVKADDKAFQAFFETVGKIMAQASQTQQGIPGTLRGLEFQKPHFVTLNAQKCYPVVYGVIEKEKQGQPVFVPVTAAFIPESVEGGVLLLAFSPSQSSQSADTNFESVQKSLEEKLNLLVKDSELDDRLLPTTAEKAAK